MKRKSEIKEVEFIGPGKPLTKAEELELSGFIKSRKETYNKNKGKTGKKKSPAAV